MFIISVNSALKTEDGVEDLGNLERCRLTEGGLNSQGGSGGMVGWIQWNLKMCDIEFSRLRRR